MQPAHACVFMDHALVGLDGAAANLNHLAFDIICIECRNQILDHVSDSYRLNPRGYPAGANHQRKLFGEAANDLEGGASCSHDDPRTKFNHGRPEGAHDIASILAAFQVLRHLPGAQSSQVNDAAHPRGLCLASEVVRSSTVAFCETAFAVQHGVHQVIRALYTL